MDSMTIHTLSIATASETTTRHMTPAKPPPMPDLKEKGRVV